MDQLGRKTDVTFFNADGSVRSKYTDVKIDDRTLPKHVCFTEANGDQHRVGPYFDIHTHYMDAVKATNNA